MLACILCLVELRGIREAAFVVRVFVLSSLLDTRKDARLSHIDLVENENVWPRIR